MKSSVNTLFAPRERMSAIAIIASPIATEAVRLTANMRGPEARGSK